MSDKCAEVEYYYPLSDPVIALGIIRHTHTHTHTRHSTAESVDCAPRWHHRCPSSQSDWCLAHRFPNIVTRMLFILLVCVLLWRFL